MTKSQSTRRPILYTSDPSNLPFQQVGRHLAYEPTVEQALADPARKQDLVQWIDQLAHHGVTIYAQAVFVQGRTLLFRSDGYETDERPQHLRFKPMMDAGVMPLQILLDECRRRGMRFLGKLRMNDHHLGAAPPRTTGPGAVNAPIAPATHASGFVRNNTQWWIKDKPGLMDYRFEPVRQYFLNFADHFLGRFDVDGLLLNYIRMPPFFPVGEGARHAEVMTAFLAEMRRVVDRHAERKGRPLTLSAMVPATLEECTHLGLDVGAWIRQGSLDELCPCDVGYPDFNSPYEQFGALMRGTRCRLFPTAIPLLCYHDDVSLLGAAEYRALANNFYGAGADGVCIFNYQYHWARRAGRARYPGPPDGYPLALSYFRDLGDPAECLTRERRYRFHPLWGGPSIRTGIERNDRIVLERRAGSQGQYRFRVCEQVTPSVRAMLYFNAQHLRPEDEIEVALNGQPVEDFHRTYHDEGRWKQYGRPLPPHSTVFFPLTSLTGRDNHLGVRLVKPAEGETEPVIVDELEVIVSPVVS